MKKLIVIILVLNTFSCISPKNKHVTIYGKTYSNTKSAGRVYACDSIYTIKGVDIWPDSLINQHLKVSGRLKVKRYKYDDNKQMVMERCFIKRAKIELLYNDSLIKMIDSVRTTDLQPTNE